MNAAVAIPIKPAPEPSMKAEPSPEQVIKDLRHLVAEQSMEIEQLEAEIEDTQFLLTNLQDRVKELRHYERAAQLLAKQHADLAGLLEDLLHQES